MGSVVSVGARWYQTGTVTVAVGNTKVTGANTKWATAGLKPGDIFTTDRSVFYEIASIESDTSLTLAQAYAGPAQSAIAYFIIRNFAVTTTAEMASNVTHLVNKYENVIDSIPTIVNSLDSSRNDAALSAGMGKELKTQVDRKLELPTTSSEIIIDGTYGDDATATGSEAKPYRTITAALNAIPAITTLDVALRIKAGIYEVPQVSLRFKKAIGGRLDFKSFSGAKDVEWRSTGPNSALAFTSMMCRVKFDGIKFSPAIGSTVPICLHFAQSQLGSINNCEFSGFPTSILAAYDGRCLVLGCSFANTTTAIKAEFGSTVTSDNNSSGSGVLYGLYSNSSTIYKVGSQPTGTTGNEYKSGGGQIFGA